MQGEFFKGDIKDVCAFLKEQATLHKGITVKAWLGFRAIDKVVQAQIADIVKSIEGDINK